MKEEIKDYSTPIENAPKGLITQKSSIEQTKEEEVKIDEKDVISKYALAGTEYQILKTKD